MPKEVKQEELQPTIFYQFYEDTFEQLVGAFLLSQFNSEIQQNYQVTSFTQLSDGKYVVRLERTLNSYSKFQKRKEQRNVTEI